MLRGAVFTPKNFTKACATVVSISILLQIAGAHRVPLIMLISKYQNLPPLQSGDKKFRHARSLDVASLKRASKRFSCLSLRSGCFASSSLGAIPGSRPCVGNEVKETSRSWEYSARNLSVQREANVSESTKRMPHKAALCRCMNTFRFHVRWIEDSLGSSEIFVTCSEAGHI